MTYLVGVLFAKNNAKESCQRYTIIIRMFHRFIVCHALFLLFKLSEAKQIVTGKKARRYTEKCNSCYWGNDSI